MKIFFNFDVLTSQNTLTIMNGLKLLVLLLIVSNSSACKSQELINANYVIFPECEITKNGEKYRCCNGNEVERLQDCYDFDNDGILSLTDGVKPKPRPSSSNCMPLPFQIKNLSKGANNMTIKYLGGDKNPTSQCTSSELISRHEMVWDKSSLKNIDTKTFIRNKVVFYIYGLKNKKLNATFNYSVKQQNYSIKVVNGQFDLSTNKKIK